MILKSCNHIPSFYFGNIFCESLKIKTPECRIIEFEDQEFKEMILHLERVTISDPALHTKIRLNIKDRPFILLLEYIPSLLLYDFGVSRAEQIFKKENFQSRELFMTLGQILGVNIFFNNSKSIPFSWNNQGDPSKIIFKINLESIRVNSNFKDPQNLDVDLENTIALDIKPFCLDPLDKRDLKELGDYLNNSTTYLKEFFYEMKTLMLYGKNIESFEFKCFSQLVDFYKNSCGIIILSYNLFHVSMGLITMLENIINIEKQTIANLINFVQTKSILKDWGDVYQTNSKKLNINYFNYVLEYLKQYKEENEEIFEWVRDVTGDIYKVNFALNLEKVIDNKKTLIYKAPVKVVPNKNEMIKKEAEEVKVVEDSFNVNKKDAKVFSNDVHNGIYDIYDIDKDPSWVLETKKREYAKPQMKKEVEITDIKIEPKKTKLDVKQIEENLDPHEIYTRDKLKEKIKIEELKDTLKVKKKFNPEEYKIIEEKIKNVDESFLNEENQEK